MAHFAEIDENGIVNNVIVVSNDVLDSNNEEASGIDFLEPLFGHRNWKQTSYNAKIRKNYAGIGFVYDVQRNAFIEPKPYPSWTLDEPTCRWQSPTPYPTDGFTYFWNEAELAWNLQDFSGSEA
jgi:hypothetical protein